MAAIVTCSVDGCEKSRKKGRSLCSMHAARWARHGTYDAPITFTEQERFWAKVDKDGPVPEYRPDLGPCWLWLAGQWSGGYGWWNPGPPGKPRPAHRAAYEFTVGSIPQGLQVDHLCRVILCVNPSHLEPVTPRENTLRSSSPAAVNARKTHCIHGHEFTEENTYRPPSAPHTRSCRTCMKAKMAAWSEAHKRH